MRSVSLGHPSNVVFLESQSGLSATRGAVLILIAVAFSCLSACGSARKVEITTTPPGAQVLAIDGSELGQTPLILTDDKLEKATQDGKLALRLEAPGHLERELILELSARDTHAITLTPQTADYFKKTLLSNYAPQVNTLTRELLQIHGLLINQKAEEAQKRISSLLQAYPSVAATHVMMAQVLTKQGKIEEARMHLLRALKLDPNDPVASRVLLGEVKVASEVNPPQTASATPSTEPVAGNEAPKESTPSTGTSPDGNPVFDAKEGGQNP